MLLVAFRAINRSAAIRFKRDLCLFAAICTDYGMHFAWRPVKPAPPISIHLFHLFLQIPLSGILFKVRSFIYKRPSFVHPVNLDISVYFSPHSHPKKPPNPKPEADKEEAVRGYAHSWAAVIFSSF